MDRFEQVLPTDEPNNGILAKYNTYVVSTLQNKENLEIVYALLKYEFAKFDEFWIVGHKGDMANNLIELGIIDESKLTLVHTDSQLGTSSDIFIPKPFKPDDAYWRDLVEIGEEIKGKLGIIKETNRKVIVFMPFANEGLENFIEDLGLNDNIVLCSPLRSQDNMKLENKQWFAEMIDKVYGPDEQRNKINWLIADSNMLNLYGEDYYDYLQQELGTNITIPLYFQKLLSAGGDGTIRIDNKEDFRQKILNNAEWKGLLSNNEVKVTAGVVRLSDDGEITDCYPANGTACIIPISEDDCEVIVDPLSHKIVALKSMGYGDKQMGIGNDWTNPFEQEINNQYIDLVTKIGKYLYKTYGYTGIFGPDGLVGDDEKGVVYKINEINPRFQGTTSYQTLNALMSNRIPIEIVHYLVKIYGDNYIELNKLLTLIGDVAEYNDRSVNENGGFYIKIPSPASRIIVKNDINGIWTWDGENLGKYDGKISLKEVYTNKSIGSDNTRLIYVKGPSIGSEVGGESTTALGYIVGSGFAVFESDSPDITDEGLRLYNKVILEMKG